MPRAYFRWVKNSSEDLTAALNNKQLRSHYPKGGQSVESRSALWVFQMGPNDYHPRQGITSDRTLVKIVYKSEGEAIMEDPENHVDFEVQGFKGEAGYPVKIIIKNNEVGARGIGATILGFLNVRVSSITEASAAEIRRATS